MTVTATAALFSIAPQAGKIGDGTFNPSALTWYRYPAADLDYGPVQQQEMNPGELNGKMTPTGAFKSMAAVAGGATLLPRLEDTIGWILYAACGTVSTVAGPEANTHKHIFTFNANDVANIPWLAARRWIPGADAASALGEMGYDNRVNAVQFTLPQMGPIRARVELQGRRPYFETEAPTWTYQNELEAFESTPVAAMGSLKIAGSTSDKFTGGQLVLANGLTTLQEEMVYGSPYPDDFAMRTRNVTMQLNYKWADPTLYRKLMQGSGSPSVNNWSAAPYYELTQGATPAIEIVMKSPTKIGATNTNHSLTIKGNKAVFGGTGIPRLVPGQMIQMPVNITLIQPESDDYVVFELVNGTASYAWPS